ncbi:MAG: GNAT family N-acetyltransferase [Campylobacterota bacterium]|nr:GNAT family N-acetyltransferase [Campylobacterota bacterium]
MKNSISLKIPSDLNNCPIVLAVTTNLCKKVKFSENDCRALTEATRALVHNAVRHAYPREDGPIEILLHTFSSGIRIDVRDWGVPMAKSHFTPANPDTPTEGGFRLIEGLVDDFHYKNLGREGKIFTVIKRTSLPLSVCDPIYRREVSIADKESIEICVSDFSDGDEESISRLIYQNYGLSFANEDFYYPKRILAKQGKKYLSIVAKSDDIIVGHFALILMPDSNMAEVGVVVVDPAYKGMGIMNKMFTSLIEKAKSIELSAIFGSAVMYHIFSQKSNLSYGFCESALLMGKTLDSIHIKGNELTQKSERGSTLIGYLMFDLRSRSLFLPKRYREYILSSYQHCTIPYTLSAKDESSTEPYADLSYIYHPLTNLGEITINSFGEDFKYKFLLILNQLREKHCDMIYADINLETIPQIDSIIKILNNRGFFYAGILFLKHNDQDYLRLQNHHSDKVGKQNMVCYSDYCSALLDYIHQDEESVKKGNIQQ